MPKPTLYAYRNGCLGISVLQIHKTMGIGHCLTMRLDWIYQIRVAADKTLTQRLLYVSPPAREPVNELRTIDEAKIRKFQLATACSWKKSDMVRWKKVLFSAFLRRIFCIFAAWKKEEQSIYGNKITGQHSPGMQKKLKSWCWQFNGDKRISPVCLTC